MEMPQKRRQKEKWQKNGSLRTIETRYTFTKKKRQSKSAFKGNAMEQANEIE